VFETVPDTTHFNPEVKAVSAYRTTHHNPGDHNLILVLLWCLDSFIENVGFDEYSLP
jgi:hypothetical protein